MVDLSPNDVVHSINYLTMRSIGEFVEYDSSIEEGQIPLILFLLRETVEEFDLHLLIFNQFSGRVRERVIMIEFVIGRMEDFHEFGLWQLRLRINWLGRLCCVEGCMIVSDFLRLSSSILLLYVYRSRPPCSITCGERRRIDSRSGSGRVCFPGGHSCSDLGCFLRRM